MIGRKKLYRLYFYFRRGYTTYIGFLLGFLNFVTIQYKLLIERIPILEKIFFGKWYVFAVVAAILIGSVSIIIGWWDMKRGSFPEEAKVSWENNPEYVYLKNMIEDIKKDLEEIKKRL